MTLAEQLRALASDWNDAGAGTVAELIRQAAEELEANRWIPVTEELPELGKPVQYWLDPPGVCATGILCQNGRWWDPRDDDAADNGPEAVTHWRRVRGPG